MVKKSAPKAPRAKTSADEVYNIRRRLKRRAASLRKQGRAGEASKLEAQAQRTYATKAEGETRARLANVQKQVQAAKNALSSFLRAEERRQFDRMNETRRPEPRAQQAEQRQRGESISETFKRMSERERARYSREMERGSDIIEEQMPAETARQALTTEERAILYGALRDEWIGAPRDIRQGIILDKYGAASEEELFEMLEERLAAYEEEREIWEIPLEEKYKAFAAM